jgi:hypothetical protein
LYTGAINLYKCGITTQNPTCAVSPFKNLTHVYGCDPIGAPAHVYPDQHALAYAIPTSGADSGNALLYFANDGGIYRALDGFTGLNTGSCSGSNQFEDLNQNLGSMTQFVSFSQHPTDPNTLLGGTQDNGSPATNQTTTMRWVNVLGGDGGYNAIDPGSPANWYASNPDIPPGGLGVLFCTSGVNCTNSGFSFVVTSSNVGGDAGAFYFPYILDPGSSTAMLVGTCRVWRGTRSGGIFTALSPNSDTLGSGTCSGSEVNQVRALAVGGSTDSNGSGVVVVMTISTAAMNAGLYPRSERSSIFYVLWLLLPGIVIGWNAVGSRFAKRWAYILSVMVLLLLALSLLSCGGASNGGTTPPPTGKQPTTYQITVTGTSSGTAPDSGQSAVVTLVVN